MVRGLDYYTGTTFEFIHPDLGAQSGIGGGGRYDGLMAELGGADLSGIGFGIGVDRVLLACEAENSLAEKISSAFGLDLFVISMGDETKGHVAALVNEARNHGIRTDMAYGDRALKGAMKAADKSGARYSLVIGADEMATGVASLKEMTTGAAVSIRLDSFIDQFTEIRAK
jgi:histidyl-tRNA synthetase